MQLCIANIAGSSHRLLTQPLVLLREEGKQGEGQGPGPGRVILPSHACILPFNYLWLRPSVSSLTTHILSSFFFNHLEDNVDYNYQGNNSFINGSQVPCPACKGYLTCQTLTQLNVIGSNIHGPNDYHSKSSKPDKKKTYLIPLISGI